eukprot:9035113-Pyramimonas_sp.AAC.1
MFLNRGLHTTSSTHITWDMLEWPAPSQRNMTDARTRTVFTTNLKIFRHRHQVKLASGTDA